MGRRHIEYINASGDCQLVAICDPDSGAAELAAKYGVPFFHDAFEALDLASPDGAIIAAPTQTARRACPGMHPPRNRASGREAGHRRAR